jgi:ABC-type dipeptide/oligopeptide/nickel transport system permease component
MLRYLIRRVLYAILVVFGVSLIVFGLTHLSGDPAALLLGEEATRGDLEHLRRELGLDQPVHVQYARFLGNAIRGDFGTSIRHQQPALELVLERLPATLQLTGASLLFVLLVGIPLGVISALKKDSLLDLGAMLLALFGQSVPSFWLGIMLILIFAVGLRWLPASGRGGPEYLVLPGITLGVYTLAVVARLQRSSMLEVLRQDYVRSARAKGLAERSVVLRHVLKNAAIPVVTVLGLQLGALLGGAVITETVFSYPGMGRLAVQSIGARDFPVIQAFVITVAVMIVIANLFVDLLYAFLDPRIAYD